MVDMKVVSAVVTAAFFALVAEAGLAVLTGPVQLHDAVPYWLGGLAAAALGLYVGANEPWQGTKEPPAEVVKNVAAALVFAVILAGLAALSGVCGYEGQSNEEGWRCGQDAVPYKVTDALDPRQDPPCTRGQMLNAGYIEVTRDEAGVTLTRWVRPSAAPTP